MRHHNSHHPGWPSRKERRRENRLSARHGRERVTVEQLQDGSIFTTQKIRRMPGETTAEAVERYRRVCLQCALGLPHSHIRRVDSDD